MRFIIMNRTRLLSIIIAMTTISLLGCNTQTPTKEQVKESSSVSENKIKVDYELQDKCGKRSEEWFKREYDGLGFHCSYKNHYNNKLNKCFILVSQTDSGYNEVLFDVHENNKLGGYTFFTQGSESCSMTGTECHSRKDWDKLVKPYMEE